MTGLEETFRRVLAARLPGDPKWAAWVDGTVHELAASVPDRPDMAMVEALTQARRDRDAAEGQVAQIRVIVNAPGAVYDDRLAGDIRAALDGPPR